MQSVFARPPLHIAIIMDGNGRWGKQQGLARADGHVAGAEAVRRTVEAAPAFGVTALTLFAFSSANWKRPHAEVEALMRLFREYLASDGARLVEIGAKLVLLGRRDRLPADLACATEALERATAGGERITLRIAIDYSSRAAIVSAAAAFRPDGSIDDLDRMIAGEAGPVDLLIRTGGQQRLSDFLLWECAYAEFWFTERMWPEFTADDLAEAIGAFRSRIRTFGALPAESPAAPLRA